MATGDATWVSRGRALVDRVRESPETLAQDPVLEANSLTDLGDLNEGASPSGQSLMARAALRLSALTGEHHYREWAWGLISPYVTHALASPMALSGVLRVVSELSEPSRELVVVSDGPHELVEMAHNWRKEGAISVVVNSSQAQAFVDAGCGLFDGRVTGETPVAYVCEGGVCHLPVTNAQDLATRLAG